MGFSVDDYTLSLGLHPHAISHKFPGYGAMTITYTKLTDTCVATP